MQLIQVLWRWVVSFFGSLSQVQLYFSWWNSSSLVYSISILSVTDEDTCIDAEAVQRAAAIAEAEGASKIQATHLERILPQLLLDF